MHSRFLVLLLLLALAAAAFITRGVPQPAGVWAVCLLVLLPAAMALQTRFITDPAALPRQSIYLSSLLSLWLLAGITIIIAWRSGMQPKDVGIIGMSLPMLLAWTAGCTAAGLCLVFAARALGVRETAITSHLMPVTAADRRIFSLLSISAGLCEEFVFRGFLLAVLYHATGSTFTATVLTAASFGVVHAYQQMAGAARAAALGIILTLPVLASGSIVPAILAHAALDLIAGLILRRFFTALTCAPSR
jgi:membrane protease YdiL (CAAX protease family)